MTLPPGRARLSTKPAPTGSGTITNTIGTVRVICCKGSHGRSASGKNHVRRKRQQFAPRLASALGIGCRPTGHRHARCGPRPSPTPATLARMRRARACAAASSALMLMSTPMRRIRSPCCPRAASGHAAAAPPSSVMNSRLFIQSPRRRGRAATAAQRARAPAPYLS